MPYGEESPLVLLLAWSTLMWQFVVVSLANVSMAFAFGGAAGDRCTMLTVFSLQIMILWFSIIA